MSRLALVVSLFASFSSLTGCATFEAFMDARRVAADPVEALVGPQHIDAGNAGGGECCVNGAFYACASAGELSQCIGSPFAMQQCAQSCPFGDTNCQPECIRDHGPNPSGCDRDPSRDDICRG